MSKSVAQIAALAHGYTMADVDRCAKAAMRKHYSSMGLDDTDRYDAAWHGVVVLLYTSYEPPTFFELLRAGFEALSRESDARRHHHGVARDGFAPKFERYWLPVRSGCSDGFTDRIIDALALPNALSVLTNEQYEAIATLAAFNNDAGDAAAALGMKYHGFMYRVYAARAKITAVWFEEETPPGSKTTGETCRSGHSRAKHGNRRANGIWTCGVCKRNSDRRGRARGKAVADELLPVEPIDVPLAPMTFAPAPGGESADASRPWTIQGNNVLGSGACWCGMAAGHDWDGKSDGGPHPSSYDVAS